MLILTTLKVQLMLNLSIPLQVIRRVLEIEMTMIQIDIREDLKEICVCCGMPAMQVPKAKITLLTKFHILKNILFMFILLCFVGCGPSKPEPSWTAHLVIDATKEVAWPISLETISGYGIGGYHFSATCKADKEINPNEMNWVRCEMKGHKRAVIAVSPVRDGKVAYVGFNVSEPQVVFSIKANNEVLINGSLQKEPILIKPGVHAFRITFTENQALVEHVVEGL